MGETSDFWELVDSNADVAPAGRGRIRVKGGALQQSVNGGAWTAIGSGGSVDLAALKAAYAAMAGIPGLNRSAADGTQSAVTVYRPIEGAAIADSSATVQPATDGASEYTVPAATFTANRTTTIGVASSPVTGTLVRFVRVDATARTWAIVNGGTNGGTLITFAASPTQIQAATVLYNGADWVLVGFEYLVA